MVDFAPLSALLEKHKCSKFVFGCEKKKCMENNSVPGSNEAGGDHGLPGSPGHTGQVVLDVHVGLDVRHELDHHDVGHRVPVKLYKTT